MASHATWPPLLTLLALACLALVPVLPSCWSHQPVPRYASIGFDEGALELSWSFPVFDYPYLKGYLQYFYGYGESLIDYNARTNRFGIGVALNDYLQ